MGLFYQMPITNAVHNFASLPIYRNAKHQYLYYFSPSFSWRIGLNHGEGDAGVKSSDDGTVCATAASSWAAYDSDGVWLEAPTHIITVITAEASVMVHATRLVAFVACETCKWKHVIWWFCGLLVVTASLLSFCERNADHKLALLSSHTKDSTYLQDRFQMPQSTKQFLTCF